METAPTSAGKEHALVIGAGIAGLNVALALAPAGYQLTLLERDAPPPEGDAETAFADWRRQGVGHLRHSHAFLARLRTLIKENHPALLAQLLDAGARELRFADNLPEPMRDVFKAAPGDDDLAVLTSRRTTLELVIRRYVESLPNVTIRSGAFVREPVLSVAADGGMRVKGLKLDDETLYADFVVDAAGRLSSIPEQLRAAGASIPEESEDCGILYFTRHYRLKNGEPERGKTSGTGDLGYIKYGLFPGDNGCFSITLAVPEIETEMRAAIVRPEVFDGICRNLPGLAIWIEDSVAEPISRVFGMGDLKSHWRAFVTDGRPAATGYFAVGDAAVRSNPLFGRGCSFAAVAAYVLRDVLADTVDPAARARLYDQRVREVLRPHFENMRTQDRAAIKRARQMLDETHKPTMRARMTKSFLEDGVAIALRSDPVLFRAALRDFHMLDKPGAWIKEPANVARILSWWARGKRANADRYAPPIGPKRTEMYNALGIETALAL